MTQETSGKLRFSKMRLAILSVSTLIVVYGLVGGLLDRVAARDDVYRDLSIFTDVLNKVKEDYVEEPDVEKAMHGALLGMVESLDPYSSFVPARVFTDFKEVDPEESATPGLRLSKRYGYAYVVAVEPGSSAALAGLRSGDLLESIEGEVTSQMSLWEVERRLAGPEGSSVDVRVIRSRRTEPAELRLTRKRPPVREVSARIIEDGVGVLAIPHFQEGIAEAVSSRLRMLKSSGIHGLVVDLRGTGSGVLEEAVAVSDLFLPAGAKVVTIRGRGENELVHASMNDALIEDKAVVVLVDGGTSGPAEVLAATLKDHEIAEVVGEKTNGFGSIQEKVVLEDGSVLLISNRILHRANGKPIQERNLRDSGVSPDVRAPADEFVTNFFFDHTSEEELQGTPGEDFYRRLNEAISKEQLEVAVKQVRLLLQKKAA